MRKAYYTIGEQFQRDGEWWRVERDDGVIVYAFRVTHKTGVKCGPVRSFIRGISA